MPFWLTSSAQRQSEQVARYGPGAHLPCATPLRHGEPLGLRWQGTDLDETRLEISITDLPLVD